MGLYDAVRKEQPRRRFHPLWAAALVFAVTLVTVLGLVISKPQRDHDRFVQCMSEIDPQAEGLFNDGFNRHGLGLAVEVHRVIFHQCMAGNGFQCLRAVVKCCHRRVPFRPKA